MFFDFGESTEFSGKAVVHLAAGRLLLTNLIQHMLSILVIILTDPKVHEKTSRILLTADLASEYGFKDVDGKTAPSMRWVGMAFVDTKYVWLANWVPHWMKIPYFLYHFFSYKF